MKKTIAILSLVASSYSLSANALFTECRLDYSVANLAFGIEFGLGGKGTAACRDVAGNQYEIPVNVQMVGGGIKAGLCNASGSIRAVGVGFALGDLLSAIGKVEVGPMISHGGSVGIGGKASPLGLNGDLAFSATHYEGPCLGIADAQGLLITQDLSAQIVRNGHPRR